jgi:cyclopropane fatty-acyl-phospholipid synthase-like methyltransferase
MNNLNKRYNPSGDEYSRESNLLFEDGYFDIIYLFSVFTHLIKNDIRMYLGDFREILNQDGRIFLTAYVERNVDDVEINPKNYLMEWKGPLHCVRYEKSYFESIIKEYGFIIERFDYRKEEDWQSSYYLRKEKII